MYYVLVIKNGAGAGEEGKHADNVTGLDTVKFGQAFSDNNDTMSWCAPRNASSERFITPQDCDQSERPHHELRVRAAP